MHLVLIKWIISLIFIIIEKKLPSSLTEGVSRDSNLFENKKLYLSGGFANIINEDTITNQFQHINDN